MLRFLRLFAILISFLLTQNATAQDEPNKDYFSVLTKSGVEYIGQIQKQSSDSLYLMLKFEGQVVVALSEVKEIKSISNTRYNRLAARNSKRLKSYDSYTQNIQSQSGFGLKKGEVRYRNTLLLANDIEGGITDNISIQAGFTWTFLFPDAGSLVWLQPKVSLPLQEDKVSTSLSFFYFRPIGPYTSSEDYFTLWQSSTSVRLGRSQMTVGLGFGKEGYERVNIPIFTLSGQIAIGRKTMLLTENQFVRSEWQNFNAYSLAVRIGRATNMDLGLAVYQDDYGDVYPLPVLQFRTPF